MAQSDRIIVLFSRWFPYNKVKEQSFLEDELHHLAAHFDKVYLVPQQIEGEKYELSETIIVDESLANSLKNISLAPKVRTIASLDFINEFLRIKFNRKRRGYILPTKLASIVTSDWITNFLKDKDPSKVVLYSFWMDFTTYGFIQAKKKFPGLKIVSRCHNFDLYGNEDNGYYVPFQKIMMNGLDGVYPDSYTGEEYIQTHYPATKCKVALMGVSDIGLKNEASKDGVFRIASCAYMIPRKRVGLMLAGVKSLCINRPDFQIEWFHIGGGPEWDLINNNLADLPSNCKVRLLGNLDSSELKSFYANTSIDLFVNTSEKEGTPVSIIEAISYGIPIMATAFGGGKEIVNRGAGVLLSANPDPEEIADKIARLIDSGESVQLRDKSRTVWEKYYNSATNYLDFCIRLASL